MSIYRSSGIGLAWNAPLLRHIRLGGPPLDDGVVGCVVRIASGALADTKLFQFPLRQLCRFSEAVSSA